MRIIAAFRAFAVIAVLSLMLIGVLPASAHTKAGVVGDCTLTVPTSPLTAAGLATPWVLSNGLSTCKEADTVASSVFVQATIFDPVTHALSVYSPLVIDAGTTPATAPIVPTLPRGAVVGIWGGGDDNVTHLIGPGAVACVNGLQTPFGQVFFCNASGFFGDVAGRVTIPALGTANDGLPCPTVRDFSVVDQDQSDNVQTTYLVAANGQIAQNTAANRAILVDAVVIKNPSDNRLLTNFLDPALGCTPWMVPDLTDNGILAPSQALDELQAAALQASPQATVPSGDPMVLEGGIPSLVKTNLYRARVFQFQAATLADVSTRTYCQNILNVAPYRFLTKDKVLLSRYPSPVPAAASNLYTFMAQRLAFTFGPMGLNCTGLLGAPNPVTVIMNGAGVAVNAQVLNYAQIVGGTLVFGGIDPIYILLALMGLFMGGLGGVAYIIIKSNKSLAAIHVDLTTANLTISTATARMLASTTVNQDALANIDMLSSQLRTASLVRDPAKVLDLTVQLNMEAGKLRNETAARTGLVK